MITGKESRPVLRTPIPGPEAKRIVEKDHRYIATTTKTAPVAAKMARGAIVEDVDGNILLDFTSGIGVVNVGHAHPKVAEAIATQAQKFTHFAGTDFYYDVQAELAKRLTEIAPGDFPKKVFFANSGAEANEAAMKVARWSTGRKQFLAFLGAFHGRTGGALSLTASKVVQKARFFPTVPGVTHVPYAYCYRCPYKLTFPSCDFHCVKIIEDVWLRQLVPPDEVAAMFVEPVQGEGGYIVPPPGYLKELRKLTDKYGMLLAMDEVQTGFGRTGTWFATEHDKVAPDLIAVAKGIASGLPMGGVIFRADLDFGVQGAHSNTYGGNPVAAAAALATMDVIQSEKLLVNANKQGERLGKRLRELAETHAKIGDVRGVGLMWATEYVEDRATKKPAVDYRNRVVDHAFRRGLLLLPCGPSGIRYIPPLNVTREQVDVAVEIMDDSMQAAAAS